MPSNVECHALNSQLAEPQSDTGQSTLRAFWALVAQSLQRHWRVRQMGWVSAGLLVMVVGVVGAMTLRPAGWRLPDRRTSRIGATYREVADERSARAIAELSLSPAVSHGPVVGVNFVALTIPQAIVGEPELMRQWAFVSYSRVAMIGLFLGFVLPLFTLSYATAAFGTERESRSLVWLMTRPLPRSAIYLAKFLGTLPWCVAFGLGGYAALCLAGGENGRRALELYWPAAVMGTVAFTAMFHLIGAIFRRPVVVGLVYVFFFEALVAALPGSLKLLSLTFYARSLMYNAARDANYPADMLDVPQAEEASVAWAFLLTVTVLITALGMWLFSRSEYRDDV